MSDYYAEMERIREQQKGKLEEKCELKIVVENPNSIANKRVEQMGQEHPLYDCVHRCEGYDLSCSAYRRKE